MAFIQISQDLLVRSSDNICIYLYSFSEKAQGRDNKNLCYIAKCLLFVVLSHLLPILFIVRISKKINSFG